MYNKSFGATELVATLLVQCILIFEDKTILVHECFSRYFNRIFEDTRKNYPKENTAKKETAETVDINGNIPLQSIFLNHYKFSL